MNKCINKLKCVLFGHKWTSSFKPNEKILPIEDRVYCARCGKPLKKEQHSTYKYKMYAEIEQKVKFK